MTNLITTNSNSERPVLTIESLREAFKTLQEQSELYQWDEMSVGPDYYSLVVPPHMVSISLQILDNVCIHHVYKKGCHACLRRHKELRAERRKHGPVAALARARQLRAIREEHTYYNWLR